MVSNGVSIIFIQGNNDDLGGFIYSLSFFNQPDQVLIIEYHLHCEEIFNTAIEDQANIDIYGEIVLMESSWTRYINAENAIFIRIFIGIYIGIILIILVYCLVNAVKNRYRNVYGIVTPIILALDVGGYIVVFLYWVIDPFGIYGNLPPPLFKILESGWIPFVYGSDVFYLLFWTCLLSNTFVVAKRTKTKKMLMGSIFPLVIVVTLLVIFQLVLSFSSNRTISNALALIFLVMSIGILVYSIYVAVSIVKFLNLPRGQYFKKSDMIIKVEKALLVIVLKIIAMVGIVAISILISTGMSHTPIFPFIFLPFLSVQCFRVGITVYLFLPIALKGFNFQKKNTTSVGTGNSSKRKISK
eukprot:TRINITY_DN2618_c0_g1_i1.p1 TRINITY_DN2618_c0_g1~~TRINITY_DN2618_c0_g1_i1.p1  ORF type:complete len:356 (-),score=39.45 TRINITY_DN2618_c0_g1_i1:23-1090(-)